MIYRPRQKASSPPVAPPDLKSVSGYSFVIEVSLLPAMLRSPGRRITEDRAVTLSSRASHNEPGAASGAKVVPALIKSKRAENRPVFLMYGNFRIQADMSGQSD